MKKFVFYFLFVTLVVSGTKKNFAHETFYSTNTSINKCHTVAAKNYFNNSIFTTVAETDLEEVLSDNELQDKKLNDCFHYDLVYSCNLILYKNNFYYNPKCFYTSSNTPFVQKSIYIINQTFLI